MWTWLTYPWRWWTRQACTLGRRRSRPPSPSLLLTNIQIMPSQLRCSFFLFSQRHEACGTSHKPAIGSSVDDDATVALNYFDVNYYSGGRTKYYEDAYIVFTRTVLPMCLIPKSYTVHETRGTIRRGGSLPLNIGDSENQRRARALIGVIFGSLQRTR